MAYASYQKISRRSPQWRTRWPETTGVGDALLREAALLRSFPLAETAQFPAVAAKAWRWEPEMREIADTLIAAELPDDLATAAAAVFERLAAGRGRDLDVDAVLDLLHSRRSNLTAENPAFGRREVTVVAPGPARCDG